MKRSIRSLTGLMLVAFLCVAAIGAYAQQVADGFQGTSATTTNYFLGPVGIGISNPTRELSVANIFEVRNFAGAANMIITGQGGSDAFMWFSEGGTNQAAMYHDASSGSMIITDGNRSDTVFVKNSRLGLATNNPSQRLHVNGGSLFEGDVQIAGKLVGRDGTKGISIDSSGNVGIGITSPTRKLHVAETFEVRNASGAVNMWIRSGAGSDGYLWFNENGANKAGIQYDSSGAAINLTDGSMGQTVTLKSQRVGIGTTSPSVALHVAGTNNMARFEGGISYIPALGDLSMGTFTNTP